MASCLRCGYDLRATPLDSPCPECGLAAHRSVIEHQNPDDCAPRWVRTIAAASVLLLVSYLAAALLVIPYIAGTLDDPFGVDYSVWSLWGLLATGFLHVLANMLLVVEERSRPFSLPVFLLNGALYVVLPLLPVAGVMVQLWLKTNNFLSTETASLVAEYLCRAVLICPIATFFRLRILAFRLSRPRLAEHITIVAIGDAVSLVYVGLCHLLLRISGVHILQGYVTGFFFALLPLALVMLFSLWSLFALFEVSGHFLESSRQARAKWIIADAARR